MHCHRIPPDLHRIYTAQGRADSNHSYGAICAIRFDGKPREYLLCNDQMVGHFALTSSYVVDRGWVASFVKSNCVGG